jgi:hypothetical protein
MHPRVAGRLERTMKRPLPRVTVDPAMQRRLAEYFEPHTAALERWLGREIESWSRPG